MRRPMSLPLYVLVVVALLLSHMPPAAAQPEPEQCPEGEVFLADQGICVPEEEVPEEEAPADDPAEEPDDPAEEADEPPAEGGDGGEGDGEEPTEEGEAPPMVAPAEGAEESIFEFVFEHFACNAGFDPRDRPNVDVTTRYLTCTGEGKPAFTYTITVDGQPVITETLQTGDGTRARIIARPSPEQPFPAGQTVISVAPVAGWESLWLHCDLVPYDSDDLGPREVDEQAIGNNAVAFATGPGDMIDCLWFNRATGTGEQVEVVGDGNTIFDNEVDESGTVDNPAGTTGATITIAAYLCPAGVTATVDLITACNQRASGLAFSLLTANETLETQTSDAEGDIFYSGVPANDYGIAATLPPGYGEPIVICYVVDSIGNVFEGQQDVVFGNQIRLRLGDGFSAECAWYNVPADGPDNGPNVFIQAWKCGEGIEITSSTTVFDAEQLCGVVYQNKEFRVQLDGQVLATKQTNDDPLSSGQVFFTRLPAPNGGGIYGITTPLAQGERILGVFCDQNYGGDRFSTVTTSVVDGNRIDQELLEGYTLRCSWFIDIGSSPVGTQVADEPPALDPTSAEAVAPEPGITVMAWLCPPEVVSQRVVLADVCIVPGEGITFDVAIGGEPSSTQTTGESGELDIPLGVVGPATYLINNQPKPGHSEPEVSCTITRADGAIEQVGGFVTAGSPGQEIAFDGASEVNCIFYFVIDPDALEVEDPAQDVAPPEEQAAEAENEEEGNAVDAPHTLTIQFWTCPDGIDPAVDQDALLQACAADPGERSLVLTIDGTSTGETVTGAGTWEFNDATVFADIGAGRTSSAWCSSNWAEGSEDAAEVPDTVLQEGGLLTVTVSHPATTVSCDWFLFPG